MNEIHLTLSKHVAPVSKNELRGMHFAALWAKQSKWQGEAFYEMYNDRKVQGQLHGPVDVYISYSFKLRRVRDTLNYSSGSTDWLIDVLKDGSNGTLACWDGDDDKDTMFPHVTIIDGDEDITRIRIVERGDGG